SAANGAREEAGYGAGRANPRCTNPAGREVGPDVHAVDDLPQRYQNRGGAQPAKGFAARPTWTPARQRKLVSSLSSGRALYRINRAFALCRVPALRGTLGARVRQPRIAAGAFPNRTQLLRRPRDHTDRNSQNSGAVLHGSLSR